MDRFNSDGTPVGNESAFQSNLAVILQVVDGKVIEGAKSPVKVMNSDL